MLVSALDGRAITVRRQWMPWRLKARKVDNDAIDPFIVVGGDDPAGFLFSLVLALVLLLFGGIILTVVIFGFEALLLLALLIPAFALARILWVLPWVIEATYGETVLGRERVRGWRDSSERIREIAAAYERGQDPFAAATAL
jgi:hypothetical protein